MGGQAVAGHLPHSVAYHRRRLQKPERNSVGTSFGTSLLMRGAAGGTPRYRTLVSIA
jgi:hypothetical protein